MFTGIIESVGRIVSVQRMECSREFIIESPYLDDSQLGESVSVNGVCLTVVHREGDRISVQAVEETLKKTTLGSLDEGHTVNLERAMLPHTRLGGHIVQGHVDCVGTVESVTPLQGSHEVRISFDLRFHDLVVPTGSICINGISLTVAEASQNSVMLAIIPHTWSHTTMQSLAAGDAVNIEFDIIGKYLQRSLQAWSTDRK